MGNQEIKTAKEVLEEWKSVNCVYVHEDDCIGAIEEYAAQFKPTWIKINSEADLPKENDFYWVMVADGVFFVAEFVSHLQAFTMKGRYMDILTVTRYAPITKPEPPKQ